MFSFNRARSGIIVLPCGAGKTLVGIAAACTIKKHTIVICTSQVAVDQWRQQFNIWSTIKMDRVLRFTSQYKDKVPNKDEPCVFITTYTILTQGRAEAAMRILDGI